MNDWQIPCTYICVHKKSDIQRIGRGLRMSSLTKCFFIDDSDSLPMVCFHNLLQGFGDFIMFRQHVKCVLACGATPECGGQIWYLGLFCRYCNQVFVIPYDALDVFRFYLILNWKNTQRDHTDWVCGMCLLKVKYRYTNILISSKETLKLKRESRLKLWSNVVISLSCAMRIKLIKHLD